MKYDIRPRSELIIYLHEKLITIFYQTTVSSNHSEVILLLLGFRLMRKRRRIAAMKVDMRSIFLAI